MQRGREPLVPREEQTSLSARTQEQTSTFAETWDRPLPLQAQTSPTADTDWKAVLRAGIQREQRCLSADTDERTDIAISNKSRHLNVQTHCTESEAARRTRRAVTEASGWNDTTSNI
ncbi:hypothetical protein NDU88_002018 [Pleurodeles waltl]|uniref:Uncharacterized protein n=1 Tax=Pleurodeles waltl TaxID=8319 RepID=A0AAV7Q8K3_PLEWA|nr:hypothetical protein NDU88_002018 [Pleurodeles waltl]